MELFSEKEIKDYTNGELLSELIACAQVMGKNSLHPTAGTNMCNCRDEVRRRLASK